MSNRVNTMPARDSNNWRTPSVLVSLYVLLVVGIVTVAIFYYRNYARHFRATTEQQLSAIAELKADELLQYRKERLWDANAFFNNPAFSGLVRRFLDDPEDTEARQQIRAWAGKSLATVQYDLVCLFDAQGVIRMSVPAERTPISSDVSRRIPEVLRSGQVTFHDFHRNEHDQQIYLTLLVPIFDGTDPSQALGVLALRINPQTYLYPFLKRWPTPSRTAETLLVRRDGNDAIFLNELKFGTNTALNRRIPLTFKDVPAVKAVLGQEGIVAGVDYRGVPAVAALHAIPDSPWFLVARIDTSEVYAPLRERLRLTLLLVSLLLISAGAGLGVIWRQQRIQFYKERYEMTVVLRESEERFRRVFEESPTGMAMLDEAFHFIQVNPAFGSMLGYSIEELRMLTFADITHPEYVQKDVEQVRRLLSGELSVYRTEKRYITRYQSELWGQVQVRMVRDADGAFSHFLVIVSNITERKQAEEDLRESRALYHSLVENLPQSVFRKDRDGRFLFVSERFCRDAGHAFEEIVGKTDADLFPPELAQAYRKDDLRVMETGQALDQEEKHLGADGQESFVQVVKTPLRDASGKVFGVQGVFWDITERKLAEAALQKNQRQLAEVNQMLQAVMDTIPARIFWKNKDLVYLGCNYLFAEDAGRKTPEDIVGETDFDLGWRVQAEQYRQDDMAIIRSGNPKLNYEEPRITPDGKHIWLRTSKVPLRDINNHIVGILGTYEDITERKRAQEALIVSESRYRRLFEAARDGILILDAGTGKVVDVNPFLVEMLGFSHQEFLGKTIWELGFFKDVIANQAKFEELQRKEYIRYEDLPLKTSAGRRINVEFVSNVYPVDHRKVIQCNIRDITERRRVEEALRHEQILMAALMENIPDGIYFKDPASRFLRVNHAQSRKLGRGDPAQLIGKSDADFFSGEHARQALADEQEIIRTGQPLLNAEEKETWPDGTVTWVVTTKLPLRDAAGRIIGTCGISRDITERKLAAETLERERALMRMVIDQINDPIFVKDPESRFMLANEAVAQIMGASSPADLLGKTDAQYYPPAVAAIFRADEERVLSGQPLLNKEEPVISLAGVERFVLTTKLPFRNPDGKVIGLVGIGHDITERRRAEETIANERQLLRTLIDLLPETIYIKDLDSRFLVGNQSLAKRLGKETPAQIIGLSDEDFFPAGLAAEFRVEEKKVIAGEPLINQENTAVSSDGREHTVLTTKLPFRDGQGRICGLVGIGHDITERKRAEEAVRESEEKFSKVFQDAPVLITVTDLADGTCLDVNAEALYVSGFNREEMVGCTEAELGWITPADRARLLQELREHGRISGLELTFQAKDGHQLFGLVSGEQISIRGRSCLLTVTVDITGRKQAEEALQESQALYHSLVEQLPAGVFRKDRAGRYVLVNPEFCRLKGMKVEDFLGRTPGEIAAAEATKPDTMGLATKYAGAGVEHHEQIMQTGKPVELVEEYVHADGRKQFLHVIKLPVVGPEGKILGTQGIQFDITERKRAEEAVRESEEKFSKVFQDAPVLITVTDLADGTCLDVNAEALNVSGFNREEVVGRTEAELGWITPADRARLLQELREHGRISGLELTFQAKDGHRLFGLVSGEQISIRGRPCLLTVTVDITERQRAEEALQESQALYHSLVEQLPSGVFRKDRAGRYVLVNPEFCRLMGMKAEDFLGKTSQEVAGIEAPKPGATVLATKYAVAGMEHHEQIMQTGKPIETVEEYVHADGRKQFLHVIKLPVVGPEGKILGTQGIQFDITGIKQAEEALEQSARELQERNDELARFTYTASHDLKSPLVTIKAFLGYLEQDTRNQDAAAMKKDLEYIYTAADKMGRLLDELLDLARVGRKMNPPEEVALQAVVKEVLDLVAGGITERGVEVVVTQEPVLLYGDRSRLVEVFQNLVDNAVKFMGDQPKPRVEIGVETSGNEKVLFVRDNGVGIEPRYQPKVFGLFEKFDPGTKGTGIGLALVKRIVEVHGGKIWVESAGIGQGATFRFTLAKTLPQPAQP
ncbi:MAG: PAS domain S-box protein [Verrucomicrobiia bacterium]